MINILKKTVNKGYLNVSGFKSNNLLLKINHRFIRPLISKYFDTIYEYRGIKLFLNPTRYIDACIIKGNEHDLVVVEYIEKLINSKEDVFIDIGANFGLFSLVAGRRGTVYSFEPSIRENIRFYKNISVNNGLVTIFPFPAAIGSENNTGKLFLGAESNTGTNSIVSDNGYGFVEIHFIKLSSVLNNEIVKRIKLIKIDVEGFEPEVIDSIIETLVMIPECTLIVEINKSFVLSKIKGMYDLLETCGYMPEKGVETESDQYNEIFIK